jgi:hypothetical protein
MIELLEGFPANVIAVSATGQVTAKDYESTLTPAVEALLSRQDKIRIYYELGSRFSGIDPGAMWQDLKLGVGHLSRWERVAIVTDVEFIGHAVNAFRFLMPGDLRVFATADAAAARAWIAAPPQ